MSLEVEANSAGGSESVSSETSTVTAESSGSNSGYSVTDPGYESDISEPADDMDSLRAENTPAKKEDTPSEESDDAGSNTEEDAEYTQQTGEAAKSGDDFSDELLDRAIELGYTLDEIKGFRSEKSLAKEVDRVEQLQKRLQERQAGKKPANEEVAPSEDDEPEPEPNWEELVEAGHDPDIVEMQKKSWQRAQKAEALVKQMYQSEQDRAWTAQCERFDESLNNLGDEYKTILGTGRRGDLLKKSPEQAANRATVFEKMIVLKNGYEQTGKPVPSEAELIQEAVQASFWKQTKSMVRKELTGQIKKAGSQALSRPNSAGAKPLSGQALATAKEAEFWAKHS